MLDSKGNMSVSVLLCNKPNQEGVANYEPPFVSVTLLCDLWTIKGMVWKEGAYPGDAGTAEGGAVEDEELEHILSLAEGAVQDHGSY